ncbi:MAG: hypothetical protein ABIN91_15330 [Mucilaginibacter sp.]|uniref:hypothetical protein n=1 Tax=Mucilaginibacter sp. TaxID=1882438 RepID=UPI0032676595
MKFETLYNESLAFWPDDIEIFDGERLDDGGILFLRLSLIYDRIDAEIKPLGEWYELMTWVIFKNLHVIAKKKFSPRALTFSKTELDPECIKTDLIGNLKADGYESMLTEFESKNR